MTTEPVKRAGRLLRGASLIVLLATPVRAQVVLALEEVNPTSSSLDPTDPDGASGGRTNGLATTPGNNQILYAATEWGGLYKSTDRGLTWVRLDAHRAVATWDVEVDPWNTNRVYATSFYDGRIDPQSGINVSTDGGATWTRPASVTPPAAFCNTVADRTQLSAFGIAIDPSLPPIVYVGTACGLAKTSDSGGTWSYIDPTPSTPATRVWDVVVHDGGIVDTCGDDGHRRSTDHGSTWRAGTGIAAGRCSIAASPDESYVLVAVVGTTIYETTNADAPSPTWTETRTNISPQGRIPFVATNQRSNPSLDVFDLWFGDVSLYRVTCTTPASPVSGGPPRCGTGTTPAWSGPFTRTAGAHDDMGDIAFDSQAAIDACPILMSSDGGVYRNTTTTSPGCHVPAWQQPNVTPRALWPFAMAGAARPGIAAEGLYFGNQDNGVFETTNLGAPTPAWTNSNCCDGFDTAAEADVIVYSVCCFSSGRSTRFFRQGSGVPGGGMFGLSDYPPSGLPATFKFPDVVVRWAPHSYAMLTRDCAPPGSGCVGADGGLFVTTNILANPIAWTELGLATEPASSTFCGLYSSTAAGTPTFFVQSGTCNATNTTDQIWKFVGASSAGTWTQLAPLPNGGGFGIFAADPNNPNRLFASGHISSGANMYRSLDGGATWQPLVQLDGLLGNSTFLMRNTRGPNNFSASGGYWQPSLIAVDPVNSNIVFAGGQDSGLFISSDGGDTFELVTDPVDGTSGIPHIPRPRYAYVDVEPGEKRRLYIGSQGRGIWRLTLDPSVPVSLQRFEVQ